jgi:RNA-directed DNA polymerase
MTRRGQRAVGQRRVWVRDLALAARHGFPVAPLDRPRELAEFLAACSALRGAFAEARRRSEPLPKVERVFLVSTAMGFAPWPVAPLGSVRDLQDVLGLTIGELRWFADTRGLERSVADERLRHYRYRWALKAAGGARLIEEPKPKLKHFQRVLLREVLDNVPVHPAAHGFTHGRSALTYASGHVGRAVVVHLDLEDFFGSINAGRVYTTFLNCGYPEPVAYLLTGLTTNSVPRQVLAAAPLRTAPHQVDAHRRLGQHLAHPHLPQGAPTSPALANLAASGLDRRLTGLAAASGLAYSRYADDLALSSPQHLGREQLARVVELAAQIANEEGFRLNPAKTRVQRRGQRQSLAGIVINERPNVERHEYERLKATVHNAVRHGPESQNRDGHPDYRSHLLGRVSRVNQLNPGRGQRLLAAFAQVDWQST